MTTEQDMQAIIKELREHHRGITFYRRMSYGKDNGHGWQKIDLKHYLPQMLEYVDRLEQRVKDYDDDYLAAISEPCGPDDRVHCTCVPALRQRITELEKMVIEDRMGNSPCVICGYNGPGYYQPETHPCAKIWHAAKESPHEGRY